MPVPSETLSPSIDAVPDEVSIELRMQMHEAAVTGDCAEVERLLGLPQGPMAARVGQLFMGDMTPLHEAILARKEAVARLLLPHSDVTARSHWTQTPLIAATESGFPMLANDLLAAGCDPNARDGKKATALIFAASMRCPEGLMVTEALMRVADPLAADENGTTALMVAAAWDRAECVKLLLGKSDPRARDSSGRTAFLCAARSGSPASLKMLALVSDTQAKDAKGRTALALACESRCRESVAFLAPLVDWREQDEKGRDVFTAAWADREWMIADEIAFFAESHGQRVPGLREIIMGETPEMFRKTRAILEAQDIQGVLAADAPSQKERGEINPPKTARRLARSL